MSLCHTFELDRVQRACLDLISQNAEHLIRHIYQHTTEAPYDDPQVRVGLALKTLLKTCDSSDSVIVSRDAIAPVTKDLNDLIKRASTSAERKILLDELMFLERSTELEELISLNTVRK